MEDKILSIIENDQRAVISNLNDELLHEIIRLLKVNKYKYYVLSESDKATHRYVFPSGLNDYIGDDNYVKQRIADELLLLNSIYKLTDDQYILEYLIDWISHYHFNETSLNFLNEDNRLFESLEDYFLLRLRDGVSYEDQKALEIIKELKIIFTDDGMLPVLSLRESIFIKNAILLIAVDDNKARYITEVIKVYFKLYQQVENQNDVTLYEINLDN